MSISGIGSTSSWTLLHETSRTRPAKAGGLEADLAQLQSDIASGDVAKVKSDLATMTERAQSGRGGRSADDPLAKALTAIGEAIDSGDLTGAASQLDALKTNLAGGPQGPPPGPPPGGTPDDSGSTEGSDALSSLLDSLRSSLESGDSSSADTAFKQLLQYLRGSSGDGSSASDAFPYPAIDLTA